MDIVLVSNDGFIFVAERSDIPGAWQMPQGGIDEGEDPLKAAFRELEEETSITNVSVKDEYPGWLTYEFPPERENPFGGNYIGQAQRWFLFSFDGVNSDIDVENAADQEFTNWQWVEPQWILEHVAPFRQSVYEAVFRRFGVL